MRDLRNEMYAGTNANKEINLEETKENYDLALKIKELERRINILESKFEMLRTCSGWDTK